MRTFVIGDIHGCSAAFRKLLERLEPNKETDRLILLGDLFDRGPDSYGVFRIVKKLADSYGDRFVLLRGNHENYLIQRHLSLSQRLMWERVGRRASVQSFRQNGARMEDCADWLEEHSVLYYKSEEPAFFQCVHAGLRIHPPEANDAFTLIHDHSVVTENEYQGPLTITGHIALAAATYFAGDKKTRLELPEEEQLILPERGAICIDAGCGKGGRLIGMKIEENRFILYSEAENIFE